VHTPPCVSHLSCTPSPLNNNSDNQDDVVLLLKGEGVCLPSKHGQFNSTLVYHHRRCTIQQNKNVIYILYCIALQCVALHCIELHCIVLNFANLTLNSPS